MSVAEDRWTGLTLNDGRTAHHTERILDTRQGDLTWLVGTVYMDMQMKPNILDDIKADLSLTAAVPRGSWRDPRLDTISLEDESGRIRLTGARVMTELLCTGIVVAVLGSETSSGDFEVIDIAVPGPPAGFTPGPSTKEPTDGSTITFVSGLELEGDDHDGSSLEVLAEYLSGELDARVSRSTSLVLIGSSIVSTPVAREDAMSRKFGASRKYGYDSSSYNARPIGALDDFLADVSQSMEVVVVPGAKDPANVTLPQQPLHSIMFPRAARHVGSSLSFATNPTWLDIGQRSIFVSAGQMIDDISHYILSGPSSSDDAAQETEMDRLELMEATLRWRHAAPTAPDTLWTYPFSDDDPFIFSARPHIYACGGEGEFAQRKLDASTLLLQLPNFRTTKQIVHVNLTTMMCEVVQLGLRL